MNVSSATIRNDMAVLEQLGYLEQPHTSAGRVPTYSGYRLYIDKLMTADKLPDDEIKRLDNILESKEHITQQSIIETAGKVLAELTQCAAIVANSVPKFSVITKVEVIPTGRRLYVILLVTSDGSIKNKACRLEFDLDNQQLEFFERYIEENLKGEAVENISDELMEKLVAAMGTYTVTLSPLLQGICELSKDLRKDEFVVTGERNLLSYDELNKMDVVEFIEHKDELSYILDDTFSGLHVLFGEENDKFVISNSSVIMSTYLKGSKPAGSLGIIGPMRLNYAKIIPYIEYFTQKITDLISEDENQDI